MVDIVLINPLWEKRQGNIWKQVSGCLPPIGIGYVASALEQYGIEVRIIDANAESLSNIDVLKKLNTWSTRMVGISSTSVNINRALKLAQEIKKSFPECQIVFGGVHPTVKPDEVLSEPSVDFVFRGEAEKHLPHLVRGEACSNIPNLSYRKNNKIIHNEFVFNTDDLDLLPMPAYHLMKVQLYRPSLGNYQRLPGMGIISSRGCPGKCTFCYVGVNGRRVRYRSPSNVIKEIVHLQDNYGIKEISFYDDNFTTSKKRVLEFCNLLLSDKIDLTWTCASRVDTVNEDILRLMKRSGCHQISYGIESGDEQILKNIRKNISLNKAKETIALTKKCGIEAKIYLMIGNPGETEETLDKTLKFALESQASGFIISIATPFPGTELYSWARENKYLKTENWEEYDTSCGVMEIPTIPLETLREFYVKAHRKLYLRSRYIFDRLVKIRSFQDLKRDFLAFRAVIGL